MRFEIEDDDPVVTVLGRTAETCGTGYHVFPLDAGEGAACACGETMAGPEFAPPAEKPAPGNLISMHPDAIEGLEELLEQARAGEVQSVAVVAVLVNGDVIDWADSGVGGLELVKLIGGLRFLERDLFRDLGDDG